MNTFSKSILRFWTIKIDVTNDPVSENYETEFDHFTKGRNWNYGKKGNELSWPKERLVLRSAISMPNFFTIFIISTFLKMDQKLDSNQWNIESLTVVILVYDIILIWLKTNKFEYIYIFIRYCELHDRYVIYIIYFLFIFW